MQFWLVYLIGFVAASKLDPVNSKKHFRRFNRHTIFPRYRVEMQNVTQVHTQ